MISVELSDKSLVISGSKVKMPLLAPKTMFPLYRGDESAIQKWTEKYTAKHPKETPVYSIYWKQLPVEMNFVRSSKQIEHSAMLHDANYPIDNWRNFIDTIASSPVSDTHIQCSAKSKDELVRRMSYLEAGLFLICWSTLLRGAQQFASLDDILATTIIEDVRQRRLAKTTNNVAQIHYGSSQTDSKGCLLVKSIFSMKSSSPVLLTIDAKYQSYLTAWRFENFCVQSIIPFSLAEAGYYGEILKESL